MKETGRGNRDNSSGPPAFRVFVRHGRRAYPVQKQYPVCTPPSRLGRSAFPILKQ